MGNSGETLAEHFNAGISFFRVVGKQGDKHNEHTGRAALEALLNGFAKENLKAGLGVLPEPHNQIQLSPKVIPLRLAKR